jgi:hypothetical protein
MNGILIPLMGRIAGTMREPAETVLANKASGFAPRSAYPVPTSVTSLFS